MVRAALVLAALLATLLALAEAAPRLLELPGVLAQRRTVEADLYQLDAAAGYVMRPNYSGRWSTLEYDQPFRTNARGLRGPDLPPKAPGEFRVVVLGDSIVFGGQVPEEQRFTERLQAVLQARGHPRVTVVNVGVPGWSTFNEAGYLAANRDWLQPDLVLLAVFLGNDVEENVLATAGGYVLTSGGAGVGYGQRAREIVRNSVERFPHNFAVAATDYAPGPLDQFEWHPGESLPQPVGNPPPPAPSGGGPPRRTSLDYIPASPLDSARTWLKANSRVYQAVTDGWFRLRHGYSRPETLDLDSWLAYTLRQTPDWYWLQVGYALTDHYLAMAQAATGGPPLVALLIPHNAEYDESQRQAELGRFRLTQDEVDLDLPRRELAAAAERHAIPTIDLLPTLSERADRDALTFHHDLHFTQLGHAVVAEALADALEQRGMLPTG